MYGFGSNIFGQLESRQMDTNKSATPLWIVLQPDIYSPIEKIASAYFHNVSETSIYFLDLNSIYFLADCRKRRPRGICLGS